MTLHTYENEIVVKLQCDPSLGFKLLRYAGVKTLFATAAAEAGYEFVNVFEDLQLSSQWGKRYVAVAVRFRSTGTADQAMLFEKIHRLPEILAA